MTARKRSRNEVVPDRDPVPLVASKRVNVTIRAGHSHRGVRYAVDTVRDVSPEELDLLQRFNGLAKQPSNGSAD